MYIFFCCMAVLLGGCKAEQSVKTVVVEKVKIVKESKTESIVEKKPGIDKELVDKLSNSMLTVKQKQGSWFYCGKKLSDSRAKELSVAISYLLIENMKAIGLEVNPFGVLGTMFNESGFDVCALGFYPRKWAYKNGWIAKRSTTISHSRVDVDNFINSAEAKQAFRKSGFDLGLFQILSKYHDAEDLLSLDPGVRIGILEMNARAIRYSTKKPWLYWKGNKANTRYAFKIRKIVERMGVTGEDLKGL